MSFEMIKYDFSSVSLHRIVEPQNILNLQLFIYWLLWIMVNFYYVFTFLSNYSFKTLLNIC